MLVEPAAASESYTRTGKSCWRSLLREPMSIGRIALPDDGSGLEPELSFLFRRSRASPKARLMALLDYTGYAAAVCTTGAYIPQVLRVWRTRSTLESTLAL